MSIDKDTHNARTNSMGWMIQRLARRLDVDMTRELDRLDLNMQQFAVMMVVLENDGLTQADIGSRFGMPAYAISRALDGLESKGYVERHAHPHSRRAHHIQSTQSGHKLAPELFAIVKSVNNRLVSGLSEPDRTHLRSLLQKVVAEL